MKVKGLILLDFDGTVVTFGHDMTYIREQMEKEVLEPMGLKLNLPHGYLLEGFELLEQQALERGASKEAAAELKASLQQKLIMFEAEGATRCKLVEGVPEALRGAKDQGYKLGIVTRGHTSYVLPLLKHHSLDGFIDAIVTREDDIPFKPDPAGVELAARRAGVELSIVMGRLYLVGDHKMDMQMAVASGAVGIGVLTGISSGPELKEAGAAHILKSLAELPSVIA